MTHVLLLAALALACVASPAFAAEGATVGDKAVILPWGEWLVALAVSLREPILTILLPLEAAYVIQAIRKVYPMAALFLTQRRVEMMPEAGVGYARAFGAGIGCIIMGQFAMALIYDAFTVAHAPSFVIPVFGTLAGFEAVSVYIAVLDGVSRKSRIGKPLAALEEVRG